MAYIRDRKWNLKNAIRKRNCKTLTDIRTVFVLQDKKDRYGKFANRQNLLNYVFESDLSWQERIAWIDRVIDYVGPKKENFEYQCILHNSVEKATELRDAKSERVSGENNPGYQHGGKLSAFSENSIYASEEVKENAIKASKKTKSENKHNENTTIEYYLHRGMGLCEAIEARKERQAVGRKENFIKRYGEEEGLRRWQERQEKWIKSHYNGINYSNISQDLFNNLIERIKPNEHDIYYATFDRSEMKEYKNKEYRLKTTNSYILPDFVCLNKKLIIEFDGDYWHSSRVANPTREKYREIEIEKLGFSLLRIKESDYKKDKEGTIKKCIEFLKQ